MQSSKDVLQTITVPDVLPSDLPSAGGSMSMTAGDFVEVYSRDDEKGQWDAILTCFFMVRSPLCIAVALAQRVRFVQDTASNVVDYLATIRRALKPNGVCKRRYLTCAYTTNLD